MISDAQVELTGDVVTFSVTPRAKIGRVVFGRAREAVRTAARGSVRARASTADRGARAARLHPGGPPRRAGPRRAGTHRGTTDLCVAARPGPRVTISSVRFPGRHRIPAAVLQDTIHGDRDGVNHVGGTYDADALELDKVFLAAKYYDAGSIDVKIGAPRVERHGPHLELTIPIEEGALYRLGRSRAPSPAPATSARRRVLPLEDRGRARSGREGDARRRRDRDARRHRRGGASTSSFCSPGGGHGTPGVRGSCTRTERVHAAAGRVRRAVRLRAARGIASTAIPASAGCSIAC